MSAKGSKAALEDLTLTVSDLGGAPDPSSALGDVEADIISVDFTHQQAQALVSLHPGFSVSFDVQL
jgi:hypothetical protein